MTAIAAVRDGSRVWMGGDSCLSDGDVTWSMVTRKVARCGAFVIGAAGSPRDAQLAMFGEGENGVRLSRLRPPKSANAAWMLRCFVPALMSILARAKTLSDQHDVATCEAELLVGVGGRLFSVHHDFHIAEYRDDHMAIGSGGAVALGALFASRGMEPRARVRMALDAAARHDPFVAPPYTILATKEQ